MQNRGTKKWQRLTALLLAGLMMAGTFAGCKKETEATVAATETTAVSTTEGPRELSVTELLMAVNELKDDLETAVEDMKEEELGSARSKIDGLAQKTQVIRESMEVTMTNLGDSVPALQSQLVNIQDLLNLLDLATETILEPMIAQMEKNPISDMNSGAGVSTQLICEYLDFAETLMPDIEKLVASAEGVDFSLVDDEGKAEEFLKTANELLEAYREDPTVFTAMRNMFGAEGDRLYVIAAQNSTEIRASGGFPGAIGAVRIVNGTVVLEDFKKVYNVLSSYTPAEANITRTENLLFHGGLAAPRDACFCPDFERVGYIMALGYEAGQGEEVDGVIALTPALVQDVLAVLDEEVKLFDGTVLTGDNATRVLQYELYYDYFSNDYIQNRETVADQLFADAARKALDLMLENLDADNLSAYLEIAGEAVEERTLMVWMADEQEQAMVRQLGWSGGLNTDPENPQAGIYFNNTAASKMGWFLVMDTQMGERTQNADGSYTYPITVSFSNAMTQEERNRASSYITGVLGGGIASSAYFCAPAGGTVSDFVVEPNMRVSINEYNGLQLGYLNDFSIFPGNTVTVTYNVTTAPGVETPLEFSKTPTVQEYH